MRARLVRVTGYHSFSKWAIYFHIWTWPRARNAKARKSIRERAENRILKGPKQNALYGIVQFTGEFQYVTF